MGMQTPVQGVRTAARLYRESCHGDERERDPDGGGGADFVSNSGDYEVFEELRVPRGRVLITLFMSEAVGLPRGRLNRWLT